MNCTHLFFEQARNKPKAVSLSIAGKETLTFEELEDKVLRARAALLEFGIGPGDSVLLLENLGIKMYVSVIALLSLGATIVLVEPWMSVDRIQNSILVTQPKLFLSSYLGYLWGARIPAIRRIPRWEKTDSLMRHRVPRGNSRVEDVPPETAGIITFTSGTTGPPKGVVRTHGYMKKQAEVLSRYLGSHEYQGTDLCIFANFALLNLASGRGSIILPSHWSARMLKGLDDLPSHMAPETLTAGPAFLLKLMKNSKLPHLKSVHVGGALTDCWIFEEGFSKWPNAHWTHIYGGSEAEPVALADARVAVRQSRERNRFQTVYLGKNIEEIQSRNEKDGLWVAGPHVCPEYLGNEAENRILKKKDQNGILWHFMGDRIQEDSQGWWYHGRAAQDATDFLLEQEIYHFTKSSKSFIYRFPKGSGLAGERLLVGENIESKKTELKHAFPQIRDFVETKIVRDKRHRARIDRVKSFKKEAAWLDG